MIMKTSAYGDEKKLLEIYSCSSFFSDQLCLGATLAKNCFQLSKMKVVIAAVLSLTSYHDLIFPGLVCRYAGEFVSEILAGIKTPERKKENDNAEEGKQRAR